MSTSTALPVLNSELKEQLIHPPFGKWIKLNDGHEVFSQTWNVPDGSEPVATLTWVHGLGEHIGRYDHVFPVIAAAGIQVHAWDQRGFGRTALKHDTAGQTLEWEQVLDDVSEALHRNKIAGKPQFLGGQSMGGLIVLDFLRQRGKEHHLAGVIATSPAIETWPETRPPDVAVFALRVLCRTVPLAADGITIMNPVAASGLSHDPAVVRAFETDPLVHSYMSLGSGDNILGAGTALARGAGAEKLPAEIPLLLMHGSADPVTYAPASMALYSRATQVHDRTLHIYDGYFHELHNEPVIREQVVRKWIAWMQARVHGPLARAVFEVVHALAA
ncbi:hypothetical protein GGF32_002368 [Allomyces javanicus]|nr:hypothetical protein GGF32_002368 [Allomyces javanicus]